MFQPFLRTRDSLALAFFAMLTCSGCFARQGPTASRIRPDTNDRYLPGGEIHFVEHGQRATGVLVSATTGFDNPFRASWATVLVPTPPTTLDGPVWTGNRASTGASTAMATLPVYRSSFYAGMFGDSVRFRFREPSVWVLSTDPFILGLPAGEPRRTWREYAASETGVGQLAERLPPLAAFVVRYAVEGELGQPLARLVVFPPEFWDGVADVQKAVTLSVVTLPEPLRLNDVLTALAAAGDPLRLGAVERVALHEHFDSDAEWARNKLADRERLLGQSSGAADSGGVQ